jgi:hypothetical protein
MTVGLLDLPPQVLWMILEKRLSDNRVEYCNRGCGAVVNRNVTTLYIDGLDGGVERTYCYSITDNVSNNPTRTIYLVTLLKLVCRAFRRCIKANTSVLGEIITVIKRPYIIKSE